MFGARTDNSNTQFAMIALWVSGRHGLDIKDNIKAVENRFRTSQQVTGNWMYMSMPRMPNMPPGFKMPPMPADVRQPGMTAAGLLAFALGYANDPTRQGGNLLQDPGVQAGLAYLAWVMTNPQDPGIKLDNYFLWSVERMGVAYKIRHVGTVDWYLEGARKLVGSQSPEGMWKGSHEMGGVDTSFALLFLQRVNVVGDVGDKVNPKADKVLGGNRLPDLDTIIPAPPKKENDKAPGSKSSQLRQPQSSPLSPGLEAVTVDLREQQPATDDSRLGCRLS